MNRFDRLDAYLNDRVVRGEMPGWQIAVTLDDKTVHGGAGGMLVLEENLPVVRDTIWRIYSMTKPVTAAAALMLWEEGLFDLTDPVSAFLPEFDGCRRMASGTADAPVLVDTGPILIWHLFTHTAGLTFAMAKADPVDELYRRAGLDWAGLLSLPLDAACARIASQPLVFAPGSEWNYSVASDVLGRLIEVVSGQDLGAFLESRVFGPLGMDDTSFVVPPTKANRLAALYARDPADGALALQSEAGARILEQPCGSYGGAGLASSLEDYTRFARMLCRGGELEGTRLLAPATMALAGANHLPNGATLCAVGRPIWGEPFANGIGFNLFGSVVVDPAAEKLPGAAGNFGWSGAAGSHFWVDPAEKLTCVFMTQVTSPPPHPTRRRIKQLVYQAMSEAK